MRRIPLVVVSVLAGALIAVVLGLVPPRKAHALASNSASSELAPYAIPAAMAPALPTKITLSGGASAGTTLASSGKCIRLSCTVACAYRVTAGASTATTDDNQLPANTPERMCLSTTQDTVTVFSSSSGAAYVSITGS